MEYQYVILPTHLDKNSSLVSLQNEIFSLFASVHGAVTNGAISGDNFLRNQIATAILVDAQPVAVHQYCFFDLHTTAARASRYFKPLGEASWRFLEQNHLRYVMSLEFLTVHPEYRKSIIGFSLADTIIALGLQLMLERGGDAGTAISRTDVKVDRSCTDLGFATVERNLDIYGYNCSFQVVSRDGIQIHPNSKIAQLVEILWQRRTDYTHKPDLIHSPTAA